MRKLRKLILSAVVCSFAMLTFAACGKKTDKEIVFDAFGTLAKAGGIDVAEEMGINKVLEGLEDKAYEAGVEFTLEGSDITDVSMLESASLAMSVASDPDEEKAGIEFGVGMGGIDLVSVEGYFDKEKIALKVPELIDKVFVLDYSGDILGKIKNSALVKMMEINTDEIDTVVNMFTEALNAQEGQTEAIMEIVEYCEAFDKETKAYSDFKDAIVVTAIDAEEFEVNGKGKKCKGYEVVITSESIVELCKEAIEYYLVGEDAQALWIGYIEDMAATGYAEDTTSFDEFIAEYKAFVEEYKAGQEEMWTQFEEMVEDIEMEMFIYEEEIVSLTTALVLTQESNKAEIPVELVCTGGKNSIYENFEFEVDLTVLDMLPITITRETESEDDVYTTETVLDCNIYGKVVYSFTYDKEAASVELALAIDMDAERMEVVAEATLEELEKGKSFEFDIADISLIINEQTLISLSGKYYVSNDVEVEMPSGTTVDILTEDAEELATVMQELMTAFESFSAAFGS